LYVVFDIKFV